MSEELKPVEVADEIKAVMGDENFVPSPEDIECYGKHQIKPSEILPCPFCGSEYLQFGDWGTHGAYDKVACGNGCTDWLPVERWNSRPVREAKTVRIAELEAERDRLMKIQAELYQDLHEAACEMCIPCWEANGMNTDSDDFGKSCPFPKSECFVKQWLETLKKANDPAGTVPAGNITSTERRDHEG